MTTLHHTTKTLMNIGAVVKKSETICFLFASSLDALVSVTCSNR
jgi:hypothetical protein